jgi:hypothetical protein
MNLSALWSGIDQVFGFLENHSRKWNAGVPRIAGDPDYAIRAKKRRRRKPPAPIDNTSFWEKILTTRLMARYSLQDCSSTGSEQRSKWDVKKLL